MNKSIAFSREKINKINSYLSKIGNGKLFLVKNYYPKPFEQDDSLLKLNFVIMLTNISSLFYDCMPWFFSKDSNTTNCDESMILEKITNIHYSDLKDQVFKIKKIRNIICHNTMPQDYSYISCFLNNYNISKSIKTWSDFQLRKEEWEICINNILSPIDTYFDSLLSFLETAKLSEIIYNEASWFEILKQAYQDTNFLDYLCPRIFNNVYDIKFSSNPRSVNQKKERQINLWKRQIINQEIASAVGVVDFSKRSKTDIYPEKLLFNIIFNKTLSL